VYENEAEVRLRIIVLTRLFNVLVVLVKT